MPAPIFFTGDVQLLGWGDTSTRGRTITLQLDGEGLSHPFRGVGIKSGSAHGQMFKMVLVAIDENGQPIEIGPAAQLSELAHDRETGDRAPKREPEGEDKPRTPFREMQRSQQAALKLRDNDFCVWLKRSHGAAYDGWIDADHLLKKVLRITTKRALDSDPVAAAAWDQCLVGFDMRSYVR